MFRHTFWHSKVCARKLEAKFTFHQLKLTAINHKSNKFAFTVSNNITLTSMYYTPHSNPLHIYFNALLLPSIFDDKMKTLNYLVFSFIIKR